MLPANENWTWDDHPGQGPGGSKEDPEDPDHIIIIICPSIRARDQTYNGWVYALIEV